MVNLAEQYHFNTERGPFFEGEDAVPAVPPTEYPVRFIAYYLPQFHPVAVNDAAWGRNFTEWTNATKAIPRYVGHYQPRLPIDTGFYDLRSVEVIAEQAALARRGGIYGFCIHNYWFAGNRVLETPLDLILKNPQVDLRFCLNWANESWSRRWDGSENQILLAQDYSAEADVAYARSMIPAVSDPRYICVGDRPLVMAYRPGLLPDARATVERWRNVFAHEGIPDPYVVMSEAFDGTDPVPGGFDATAGFAPHKYFQGGASSYVRRLDPLFRGAAKSYAALAEAAMADMAKPYRYLPSVCPDWDNEARKPRRGTSFYGSTPALYGHWLEAASRYALEAPADERIVFINAWNEWAEGAYLEADRHYGYAYLAETARVFARVAGKAAAGRAAPTSARPPRFTPGENRVNYIYNRGWSALRRISGFFSDKS